VTKLVSSSEDVDLLDRARRLPQGIEPKRDLWPGIETALEPPATRQPSVWGWVSGAFAAALLLALAVNLNLPSLEQVAEPLTTESPQARLQPQVVGLLDNQLPDLSPEDRAIVLENLLVIEQARADIQQALSDYPHSALLQRRLVASYTQELGLLKEIESLTRRAKQRIQL